MEIKNVLKDEKKKKTMTVRTFVSYCEWMTKNKVSPTKVFNEAVKQLMEKAK
jgi:hypothetical protein